MKKLITWMYYKYVIAPMFTGDIEVVIERHEVRDDQLALAFHERRVLNQHGIRTDH